MLTIVVLFQIMAAASASPTVWGLKARLPDDQELIEGATWIPSLKWSAGKIWMKTKFNEASTLSQEGLFWEKEECKKFREHIKVTKIEHTLTHAQYVDKSLWGSLGVGVLEILDKFWPLGGSRFVSSWSRSSLLVSILSVLKMKSRLSRKS